MSSNMLDIFQSRFKLKKINAIVSLREFVKSPIMKAISIAAYEIGFIVLYEETRIGSVYLSV